MRITRASKNWRHVSIFLLAVAVSAALLFTMLTGADGTRVEAQTADTPTPAPTATAAPGGTEETDANADGGSESEQNEKADAPKYGNMDSILNGLGTAGRTGDFEFGKICRIHGSAERR